MGVVSVRALWHIVYLQQANFQNFAAVFEWVHIYFRPVRPALDSRALLLRGRVLGRRSRRMVWDRHWIGDEAVDGELQVNDRLEDAALKALAREFPSTALSHLFTGNAFVATVAWLIVGSFG